MDAVTAPTPDRTGHDPLVLRRVIALCIDWAVALAISGGFFDLHSLATLGIFAVMTFLLVMTLGSTIGHRLLGLVVVRYADGRTPPSPLQALIRTVALCLVVPVGITDGESRGMHDVWAGTRIQLRKAAS